MCTLLNDINLSSPLVRPKLTLYVNKGSDACEWWEEQAASDAVRHLYTSLLCLSTFTISPSASLPLVVIVNSLCAIIASSPCLLLHSCVLQYTRPSFWAEQVQLSWLRRFAPSSTLISQQFTASHGMPVCPLVDCLSHWLIKGYWQWNIQCIIRFLRW